MKDVNDVEIRSGAHVHIMGKSVQDPSFELDVHCLVVGLRGRGIKFVDEVTGKEYPSSVITEDKMQIWVLEPAPIKIERKKVEKRVQAESSPISQEQIDTINQLKEWGWYGTWYKDVDGLATSVKIEKPTDRE